MVSSSCIHPSLQLRGGSLYLPDHEISIERDHEILKET